MRAGRMDRRITLQRRAAAQDEFGEEIVTWVTVAPSRAASVGPVRGEERFTSAQFISKEQTEFRIRWSASLANFNPLDRVVYPAIAGESPEEIAGDRIYDVMSVHELGRQEGLVIRAARRSEAPYAE